MNTEALPESRKSVSVPSWFCICTTTMHTQHRHPPLMEEKKQQWYSLCDTSPGEIWTNIYSLQIGNWWQIKSIDTTKVQPGKPRDFIGWLKGIWVKGCLLELKWSRNSYIPQTCTSVVVKAHGSNNTGAHCIIKRQLNWLERVSCRHLSLSLPFTDILACLCLCQVAQLLLVSSWQLG